MSFHAAPPGDLDCEFDRAIGKRLFENTVPLTSRFEFGFLYGITLQEFIEFLLFAPATLKVVVLEFAAGRVADDGILPAGQLDAPAGVLAVVELGGPLRRRGQCQPLTGCRDRYRIADLGLDLDNVGH